jgi:fibronectin-binding autotransporter adhesin
MGLTLSGANTCTGSTDIVAGTLHVGADNALPIDGTVTFGNSLNGGTLDLNGHNRQVAGLAVAPGANPTTQKIGNGASSGLADATLTFDSAGASIFGGTIKGPSRLRQPKAASGGLRRHSNPFGR